MSGTSDRTARAAGPEPREATTVLVVDDPETPHTRPPAGGPLVVIGFTAADVHRAREAAIDRSVWFVDATPSDAACAESGRATGPPTNQLAVESVGSPTDLTGVGVGLERCCDAVTGEVACWVPSLTALLQYVDRETAFRFCNAVTNRIVGAEGTVRFRLCGDAHDQRAVATFVSLADQVVRPADS